MAYNVRIMEKAEQDLSDIVTYFTDKLCNPKAADSLLEGFHRFLFKKNYIALYLINDDKKEVSIMGIFYAKRDYGNLI